jgi:hypothetical protein
MVATMTEFEALAETAANAEAARREAVATEAAEKLVAARAMLANIKKFEKAASDRFKSTAKLADIETVELPDGTLVTRIEADRRTLDADVLADEVSANVYNSVTETKVVHGKFDAAVKVGTISKKVAKKATSETPYVSIKVTYSK